ncbi:CBS domain-containing protein [Streptomyces sp. NPDC002138]|uniref:CBS domain-containing protein n=1 Tax=Streptomyces sp. NPDC002138 TaxID=3154410 RepID=UPI00332CB90E
MSPNATHLPKPGAKTARDLMTPGAHCVGHDEPVLEAARRMAELGVGALPIRDADGRLIGMITDRDIVVRVLVPGKDPATTPAGELAGGEAVTVGPDDHAEKILRTMAAHKVRRLPVLDGHRLVGMVAQADVARALPHPEVGALLNALSSD